MGVLKVIYFSDYMLIVFLIITYFKYSFFFISLRVSCKLTSHLSFFLQNKHIYCVNK